ncbi:hypothetical protein DSECCO2_366500 [anaerobic digester metagenome]
MDVAGKAAESELDDGHQCAQVADVAGGKGALAVDDGIFPDEACQIATQHGGEITALSQGQVSRGVCDEDLSAHGMGSGLKGAVDLAAGIGHGFQGAAPDVVIQANPFGDGIDGLAAFGDDAVHPDHVVFPEGLALGIDGHQSDVGRLKGIYPQMRGGAGVGGLAGISDLLGQEAIEGGIDVSGPVRHPAHGMAGNGQIDVVEHAAADHILLAGHVADEALFHEAAAEGKVGELLRRSTD